MSTSTCNNMSLKPWLTEPLQTLNSRWSSPSPLLFCNVFCLNSQPKPYESFYFFLFLDHDLLWGSTYLISLLDALTLLSNSLLIWKYNWRFWNSDLIEIYERITFYKMILIFIGLYTLIKTHEYPISVKSLPWDAA